MKQENIKTSQPKGIHDFQKLIQLVIIIFFCGILGFVVYWLLERHFLLSDNAGLVGGLFALGIVGALSLVVPLVITFTTQRFKKYILLLQLGIACVIYFLIAIVSFFLFWSVSSDVELSAKQTEARDYSVMRKAKNIEDCEKITTSWIWDICIREKLAKDADFQTCQIQAKNRNFDVEACTFWR